MKTVLEANLGNQFCKIRQDGEMLLSNFISERLEVDTSIWESIRGRKWKTF